MNIAISKQKLTFILTGYRDVLRISLFADYEQIFNGGLQPRGKLNIISFACKMALWSDPSVTADALEKTYQSKHISELKRGFVNKLNLDTYKVKIATLIYNIYNRITPSCLEHIVQRKEHKYDLRHQNRVSAQRFETWYEKLYFSWRIHCLEYLITIRCQPQGLLQKGKKVSHPQKLEL